MIQFTRREFLHTVGCAVASTALGATQPRPTMDLTDAVQGVFANHTLPGLMGAIVDIDGLVGIGAVGLRKYGSPEVMTAGDQIHLGSDTKAMTATLIARRIESKKFSLDNTMRERFPTLAAKMNPAMASVTLSQLLNHTSGLPANVDWWAFSKTAQRVDVQRLAIAEQVLSAPPLQEPGSKYLYSNVGYTLLGAMIEADAGRPWEEVIGDELFKPLGMTSAGFGPPGTEGKADQPWGHALNGTQFLPLQQDNAPPLGPAGRVHCTMSDWGKFIQWALRVQTQDTPLLSTATEKLMLTPAPGRVYAGGWILANRPWAGGRTLSHAGSNTLWYCVAWLAPRKRFAVLAATNVAGADAEKACDDLSGALIRRHAT